MELRLISSKPVSLSPHAHVVVCKIKNEALRIPYYVSCYRKLGFDSFIFIDNGSGDGTREFLLAEPDCHVFSTTASFRRSKGGISWINGVLEEFCEGRWVLVADADEILVWPGSEGETIQALTQRLDKAGAQALFAILLDMYSDKPFGRIGYRPGEAFHEHLPYFDKGPYQQRPAAAFPYRQLYGGVRARLFNALGAAIHSPTVSKVPLVKWSWGQRFILSTHGLYYPMALARMRGALLHYKFFDDFLDKCRSQSAHAEYYEGGREYRVLGRALAQSANASFYDPEISMRYTGTGALARCGLIDAEKAFVQTPLNRPRSPAPLR